MGLLIIDLDLFSRSLSANRSKPCHCNTERTICVKLFKFTPIITLMKILDGECVSMTLTSFQGHHFQLGQNYHDRERTVFDRPLKFTPVINGLGGNCTLVKLGYNHFILIDLLMIDF
jgi:hypothetical protein